jgi:hypothetical protein
MKLMILGIINIIDAFLKLKSISSALNKISSEIKNIKKFKQGMYLFGKQLYFHMHGKSGKKA